MVTNLSVKGMSVGQTATAGEAFCALTGRIHYTSLSTYRTRHDPRRNWIHGIARYTIMSLTKSVKS